MGYKKILRVKGKIDYIVGNFMIYVPRSQMPMLSEEFEKQKREIYSDRFFTRLVQQGKVVLAPQGKLHFLPKDFRDSVFGEVINPGKKGTITKKIKVKPQPSSLASKILKDLKKKQ